jgi:hypothetical protein
MSFYTLIFGTDNGNRRSFRIKNPLPGLTQDAVQEAVQMLLDNPIMAPERGQLARLNRIDHHVTSVTQIA